MGTHAENRKDFQAAERKALTHHERCAAPGLGGDRAWKDEAPLNAAGGTAFGNVRGPTYTPGAGARGAWSRNGGANKVLTTGRGSMETSGDTCDRKRRACSSASSTTISRSLLTLPRVRLFDGPLHL